MDKTKKLNQHQRIAKYTVIVLFCLTLSLLTSCYSYSYSHSHSHSYNYNYSLLPVSISPTSCYTSNWINKYQYFYIIPTSTIIYERGSVNNGTGYSNGYSMNPADELAGYLQNKGLIRLSEIKNDKASSTLVVSFAISGRRPVSPSGAYTTEVILHFTSADTDSLICSCKAEGLGSSEIEDIREALQRCFNELNIQNK